MSIKCSLLGHSFGETTVERERDEEGTEVVITITEMETCSRCGETRVVSENKEVTTLETPGDESEGNPLTVDGESDDDDEEGDDAADRADEFATTAGEEGDGAGGGTDAVILGDDDGDEESSAQAEARGAETSIPDAESGGTVERDPGDEDAVIIDDAESDRGPGEWPDEDDGEESADERPADEPSADDASADAGEDDDRDPGEWPDEPTDPAERAGETDEVEILDSGESDDAGDGTTDPEDVDSAVANAVSETATVGDGASAAADAAAEGDDRGAGAWPEEESRSAGGDAMGEWPEETLRDVPADAGASGPSLDGEEERAVDVPEGTFKCAECGFTTEIDSSSLRAGDFCPECHRGTLLGPEDERPDEE